MLQINQPLEYSNSFVQTQCCEVVRLFLFPPVFPAGGSFIYKVEQFNQYVEKINL